MQPARVERGASAAVSWPSRSRTTARTPPHTPDNKLPAISDRNELVLWRWDENMHERIDLGRRVES
jgi:hypothetical protein